MIRICSKCGALLLDDSEDCSFCASAERNGTLEPVTVGVNLLEETGEPEWRLEVSRRLEQYRARRGHLLPEETQSGLPFQRVSVNADSDDEEIAERLRPKPSQRHRQTERVDICIQPELNFSSSPDDRARPQTALVPVATLAERRWAGIIDAIFLGLTCAGFMALFRSLGGRITLEKTDAIVYVAVAYLFYALYISIFTLLAGATPGMQFRNLTVVRLDGSLADPRQLVWRTFGYLLSGATLMLGFVWSLWDEDHFTWQDRISQTYITAAAPLSDLEELDIPARVQQLAHK